MNGSRRGIGCQSPNSRLQIAGGNNSIFGGDPLRFVEVGLRIQRVLEIQRTAFLRVTNMSIDRAEELKRQLTDKYVIVDKAVPQLRRFVGLTGRVKTVNMNCRALVEFDSPEDISWYDINPQFLKVIDAPLPKKSAAKPEPAAAKPAPAKTGTANKPATGGKLSPLELARQQAAAAKAGGDPAPAPAAKKLSPLELARQQDAAKKAALAGGDGATPQIPPDPKPDTPKPPAGKKLSPLELARQQDKNKAK